MRCGRQSAWFTRLLRSMHRWTVLALFLSVPLACERERSSGAAPAADTSRMTSGPTSGAVNDTTAARMADTTGLARADTTPPGTDTTKRIARQPAARTPVPKPQAKPAPAQRTDTSTAAAKPAAPAPAQQETSAAAKPADTAAQAPSAEANAPLRDIYHRAPLDTVSQQVYDGWKQFNLNCARCHGEDVQGTTIAPHLIVSLRPDGPINTKELFVQTVCAGRPEKGMPSWCALGMEKSTIDAIYSYVKGRSDAKIHPGRPALRQGG